MNPNGQVPDLIQSMKDAGSMAYSRAKVQGFLDTAEKALSSLPDHPSRRLLLALSSRLAGRQL